MPKKILLAEDSLTIQKVFELTFAQSDFALTMVDNGTDAVRLASEIAPDLVVADVTLPGRDGFEVAGDLAAAGATRGCPVLILSGSLGPFDEVRFKGSGARGVLFKPFESQELIDKVNEMLSAAEAAGAEVRGETPAPGTEEWDFSDVLEEVDERHGRPAAPAAAAGEGLSLGEFDVSVESFDVPVAAATVDAPTEPAMAAPEDAGLVLPELDESYGEAPFSPEMPCEDEPAGITDISPALAEVGEIEEIEDLEAMELLHKESEGPLAAEPPPAPAAEPIAPADEPEAEIDLDAILGVESVPDEAVPDLEPAYAAKAEPDFEHDEDLEAIIEEIPEHAPAIPAAAPAFATSATDAEAASLEALREQFSARAREIVEKVAAEAVEKVMWEWMDRLSAEFTERIRESVESVAWDVIPKTAEALVREEIARIREQEGRQGESR